MLKVRNTYGCKKNSSLNIEFCIEKRYARRGGVYRTKETMIRRKVNMKKQRNEIKRVLQIAPLSIENP